MNTRGRSTRFQRLKTQQRRDPVSQPAPHADVYAPFRWPDDDFETLVDELAEGKDSDSIAS